MTFKKFVIVFQNVSGRFESNDIEHVLNKWVYPRLCGISGIPCKVFKYIYHQHSLNTRSKYYNTYILFSFGLDQLLKLSFAHTTP